MTAPSASVSSIPAVLEQRMRGHSWHDDPECPAFSDLALVTVDAWTFDGSSYRGALVVGAGVADDVAAIFDEIYAARFPIAQIRPICEFDGSDDVSMAANNASCFNFRRTASSGRLSQHALGLAIDINPVQNPMILNGKYYPPVGADYADRAEIRPGMLKKDGPVVAAFAARGWEWGGNWTKFKDYHHFSQNGD